MGHNTEAKEPRAETAATSATDPVTCNVYEHQAKRHSSCATLSAHCGSHLRLVTHVSKQQKQRNKIRPTGPTPAQQRWPPPAKHHPERTQDILRRLRKDTIRPGLETRGAADGDRGAEATLCPLFARTCNRSTIRSLASLPHFFTPLSAHFVHNSQASTETTLKQPGQSVVS